MKKMVYVTASLRAGVAFIKANTDWKQVTSVSFRNECEKIIVISSFDRMRGRKFDGVYIDYSFTRIRDQDYIDFVRRFDTLGIEPVEIKESFCRL